MDHSLVERDVYNARSKLRLKNLAGRSPMEALIATLEGGTYTYDYCTDMDGRITHLFFAHPKSVELFHKFPDVLLLDCTYRTNKFKMLLLNIVGTTCLNRNFHIAFCFLAKEEAGDYVWALEQLWKLLDDGMRVGVMVTDREIALINACHLVFSEANRLLCTWHVEKNVLTHASEFLDKGEIRDEFMKAWTTIIQSGTPQAYEENWNELQRIYDTVALGLVQYMKET
jgi:hypothetical protein